MGRNGSPHCCDEKIEHRAPKASARPASYSMMVLESCDTAGAESASGTLLRKDLLRRLVSVSSAVVQSFHDKGLNITSYVLWGCYST